MTDPKPYTPEEWNAADAPGGAENTWAFVDLSPEMRDRVRATVQALAAAQEALRKVGIGCACGGQRGHSEGHDGEELYCECQAGRRVKAEDDLAEARDHVQALAARLESIARRATARNLVVEDWNHIGPEVDAARAWLAQVSAGSTTKVT